MSKISDFCKDRAAFYSSVVGTVSPDDDLLLRCKEMLKIDIEEIAELKAEIERLKEGCKTAWCDPIRELRAENERLKAEIEVAALSREVLGKCIPREEK